MKMNENQARFVQCISNLLDAMLKLSKEWETNPEAQIRHELSSQYPFPEDLDEVFHKVANWREAVVASFEGQG